MRVNEAAKYDGKNVTLRGWISYLRPLKKIVFLLFRDGTGVIQCIGKLEELGDEQFKLLSSLTSLSSIEISGKVVKSERPNQWYDILVSSFKVLQLAPKGKLNTTGGKTPPIEEWSDIRHLWLRSEKQMSILQIRDEVVRAAQEFLSQTGFIRTDAPVITPIETWDLMPIPVTYYPAAQGAHLSTTAQWYLEALAMSLEKVYSLGPVFHGNLRPNSKQLAEMWALEVECAFEGLEEVLERGKLLLVHIFNQVIKNRQRELEFLKVDPSDLKEKISRFDTTGYGFAALKIFEANFEFNLGQDIEPPHQAALMGSFRYPLVVNEFSAEAEDFTTKQVPEKPGEALAARIYYPHSIGTELLRAAQRVDDYDTLAKLMQERGIDTKKYKWYLDLRQYGSVPHSGFRIGIENVVSCICGLDNLREAIPFARLVNRITP